MESINENKIKTSKQVTFCSSVRARRTISRHDYTDDEIQATWYSSKEYSEIARSCLKQVQRIEAGLTLKDKKYCSRGLERHTKIGKLAKDQNRQSSIQAVLDEQDRQVLECEDQHVGLEVFDEISIAEVYGNATSNCQVWANAMGLMDQRAVRGDCYRFKGTAFFSAVSSSSSRRVVVIVPSMEAQTLMNTRSN